MPVFLFAKLLCMCFFSCTDLHRDPALLQGAMIAVIDGGSLSLGRLALPQSALHTATAGLSGAGSRLVLEAVTVPEQPALGALTGTFTNGQEGEANVFDVSNGGQMPFFLVLSGPCTMAEDGRCVGRWPSGYFADEDCIIAVAGAGVGLLGGCPVFDLNVGTHTDLSEPHHF